LSEALYDGKYRWVVEADIRGFLLLRQGYGAQVGHINRDWLVKMLEEGIADKSLIRIHRSFGAVGISAAWTPATC